MLNIAIAGLGTVGSGVVRLLQKNKDLIAARAGQPIAIKAVSARDATKKRECDWAGATWVDDPRKLAEVPGVDVVVEVIGCSKGVADEVAKSALNAKKHFITANKALMATKGAELARLAEQNKVQLSFEAAVAGGIPIIKTIREGLAGNHFASVRGILNGTCNYILTRMQQDKMSFDAALKEAQQKGYAEADPATDVDGKDTANKLAILAALAFGTEPDLASIDVQGIRHVMLQDIQFAEELGCRIKLLGVAHITEKGLEQRVRPALVPKSLSLAGVKGAVNAVLVRGDFVGDLMLEGNGAGADATASAVVSDIVDVARGRFVPAFGAPAASLKKLKPMHSEYDSRYYVRMQTADKPGVVADISSILRDEAISIESLLQHGRSKTESVAVVMTLHETNAKIMQRAVEKIASLSSVKEKPCLLPIED